ncbi:DoxX family protein [Pedococcus sp. 5OH_020]|uniref:DoxX family protein n=1 Tax=Pedococcus sp. 5OH_020 TaxID=2989814 RepID=UPI0022E9C118|nr:DoxX family protein [Pedococcus sp. 5OH_020]
MQIGRLAARVVIGGLFVGHGTQKLFGWFGGPGLEGTEQMMGAIQMRPTRANALAAGVSETAGGALLIAGAATPLAASALIGTMVTAIRKVHQPKGVWAAQGGWEYNAVLIAALLALVDAGPGDVSVDSALGRQEWGPGWAVGGLAAGAAASAAAIALGRHASSDQATSSGSDGSIAKATTDDTAGDPVTKDSAG